MPRARRTRQRLRHRPRRPRPPSALPPGPGDAQDSADLAVHPDARPVLRRPRPLAEPAPWARRSRERAGLAVVARPGGHFAGSGVVLWDGFIHAWARPKIPED